MWVGTNTDVHEQRLAANELRRLAADLSEADRRKDEFLAILAHELRNPLAPLSNAAQLLRLSGSTDQGMVKVSEMIERQVAQMVRLVDDLLDISRVNHGKIELRKQRVALEPVIRQAVDAASDLAHCMEHKLTVSIPEQPIFVFADPMRLTQIVGNLLSNACKFTDRRGHIALEVERTEGHAVIRVRDTGIGIAPEQLGRIFEMFAQIDTSLERSRSGLGIGLTLVKTLVEMHGGSVEVRSDGVGRGTEFIVRLPLPHEAADAMPPQPTRNEPDLLRDRRILVVDDNRDAAVAVSELLGLIGNQTQMAHDGLEAVERAASFDPDIVLLDIGLPKLNGYEVARKIRQQANGAQIVLIALTGWGQDNDRKQSAEAGFDGHLTKPLDLAVLSDLLLRLP